MDTNQLVKLIGRPVEVACDLFQALLGKPFAVAGDIAADELQMWQWKNRVRIAERVDEMLRSKEVARRVLPPDFLVPLLRSCGDASNESIQEAWARLLVAAVASDDAQYIAYVRTLQQLSPSDVRVLDALIRSTPTDDRKERAEHLSQITGLPPNKIQRSIANFEHLGFFTPTQKRLRTFAFRFLEVCIADPEVIDAYRTAQAKLKSVPIID